jgi:hypothetical protein
MAVSATEESPVSNELACTTPAFTPQPCTSPLDSLDAGGIRCSVSVNSEGNAIPEFKLYDDACDEAGTIVLRSTYFGPFIPIDTLTNANPFSPAADRWFDSSALSNVWYQYQFRVFNAGASKVSGILSVYFYDPEQLFTYGQFHQGKRHIVLDHKRSEIPA